MFTDNHELGRLIADRLILLDQVLTMRAERDRLVAALEDKHAPAVSCRNFRHPKGRAPANAGGSAIPPISFAKRR